MSVYADTARRLLLGWGWRQSKTLNNNNNSLIEWNLEVKKKKKKNQLLIYSSSSAFTNKIIDWSLFTCSRQRTNSEWEREQNWLLMLNEGQEEIFEFYVQQHSCIPFTGYYSEAREGGCVCMLLVLIRKTPVAFWIFNTLEPELKREKKKKSVCCPKTVDRWNLMALGSNDGSSCDSCR